MQYRVLLKKIDGSVAEFRPYGVNKITGDAIIMDLSKAKTTFPTVFQDMESPGGLIRLLIGMDHFEDAPREQERGKNLVLYKSAFETGYMVCRNMSSNEGTGGGSLRQSVPQKVLSCRSVLFEPPEFIPAEAMGTELPRRCPACKNCTECQFCMDSLSFKKTLSMI